VGGFKAFKKWYVSCAQWLTPVILATWEARPRLCRKMLGMATHGLQSLPDWVKSKTQITWAKRLEACLKYKFVSSNPSTTEKEKRKKERNGF
jgi:hypothetical protein